MDLFKQKTMKYATSLDWNAKCCKRVRGDTQRIHKNARTKLKNYDRRVMRDDA